MVRVFVSLIPHRARAALRSPLGGYAVLLAAPSVIAVARGGRDLRMTAGFALLATGSACAFVFDDVSRDGMTACPRGWTLRHLAGSATVAGAAVAAWAVIGSLVLAYDAQVGSLTELVPEAAAAATLAVAFVAVGRASTPRVGIAAAVGALLAMFVTSGLSTRRPLDWLPTLGVHDHAQRWWTVAAVAGVCAAWLLRDPAASTCRRPSLHRRPGRPPT